jgi:hypothetical protein
MDKLVLMCGLALYDFLLEHNSLINRGLFVILNTRHTGTLTQGSSVIFRKIAFVILVTNSPYFTQREGS